MTVLKARQMTDLSDIWRLSKDGHSYKKVRIYELVVDDTFKIPEAEGIYVVNEPPFLNIDNVWTVVATYTSGVEDML